MDLTNTNESVIIKEDWKTIEEFDNYEISNIGRVRIKKTTK